MIEDVMGGQELVPSGLDPIMGGTVTDFPQAPSSGTTDTGFIETVFPTAGNPTGGLTPFQMGISTTPGPGDLVAPAATPVTTLGLNLGAAGPVIVMSAAVVGLMWFLRRKR